MSRNLDFETHGSDSWLDDSLNFPAVDFKSLVIWTLQLTIRSRDSTTRSRFRAVDFRSCNLDFGIPDLESRPDHAFQLVKAL